MKKILSVILIILFSMSIPNNKIMAYESVNEEKEENLSEITNKVYIEINQENIKELPKNFRKTNDKIISNSNKVNLEGLSELNASGSAQFSKESLGLIKNSIGNRKHITVVDLRQESHGFVNGIAISWRDNNNQLNRGLTYCQVVNKENKLLGDIKLNSPLSIGKGKTIIPTSVENENCVVNGTGLGYKRIMVTDSEPPTGENITDFVHFVKTMPKDTWLHFHCEAGEGRTTTFMAMYDMMRNAKKVSFEDIIARQELIGGINLSTDLPSRFKILENFYSYCKENTEDFKVSWNEWINSKCQ